MTFSVYLIGYKLYLEVWRFQDRFWRFARLLRIFYVFLVLVHPPTIVFMLIFVCRIRLLSFFPSYLHCTRRRSWEGLCDVLAILLLPISIWEIIKPFDIYNQVVLNSDSKNFGRILYMAPLDSISNNSSHSSCLDRYEEK